MLVIVEPKRMFKLRYLYINVPVTTNSVVVTNDIIFIASEIIKLNTYLKFV
jgi:hypothetical protein